VINPLGSSAAVNRILSRLDGVRPVGDAKWIARCPAHEDRSPSLSIRQVEDRLLIHDHAGCEPAAIVAALGLSLGDLFNGRATRRHRTDPTADLRRRAEIGLGRWLECETRRVGRELRERDSLARSVHQSVAVGSMTEADAWDSLARAYVGYAELEYYFERLQNEDPLTLWREQRA
jgi:hypothetical protein